LSLAIKMLDVVTRVQPKTEISYILGSKILFIKENDTYSGIAIKKLAEVSAFT